MAKKREKISFDDFYSGIYREEEWGVGWERLREKLSAPAEPVAFSRGLVQPYYLDEASRLAADLLRPQPGEKILDMCAAPGGKSLVLASLMSPLNPQGRDPFSLTSNDRSANRRRRLRHVMEAHLPTQVQDHITITSHDASRWGLYEENTYHRILLDAPCSSERHLLHQAPLLQQWSPHRTKRLAQQQYAMAAAALTACRPGGRILYSTCSLSPRENQDVMEKLLCRKGELCREVPLLQELSEEWHFLSHGALILPRGEINKGPLYVCMIEKKR